MEWVAWTRVCWVPLVVRRVSWSSHALCERLTGSQNNIPEIDLCYPFGQHQTVRILLPHTRHGVIAVVLEGGKTNCHQLGDSETWITALEAGSRKCRCQQTWLLPEAPRKGLFHAPLPAAGSCCRSLAFTRFPPTSAAIFTWFSSRCISRSVSKFPSSERKTAIELKPWTLVHWTQQALIPTWLYLKRSYFQIGLHSQVLEIRIWTCTFTALNQPMTVT